MQAHEDRMQCQQTIVSHAYIMSGVEGRNTIMEYGKGHGIELCVP
jgi:hypothetical protein